ncbi:MAG: response regulator transcription factor [Patescibacteria group bacterium]|nr:response regulator transcription factor [Patescibacteria group bacterium]
MKVLVIDDDRATAETIRISLASYSHTVEISTDGSDGSFMARSYEYDAIVLDQALPRKDGLTVCKEIRSAGRATPILFLSVDGDTETKVAAFKNGADDYVTKPFSLEELRARLGAVSRRAPEIKKSELSLHDISLDPNTHTVLRGGAMVRLTRKEFNMLEYFMRHPGIVISRAQLMEHIWTADSNPFSNTIEAHLRNLRKKLNAGGAINLIVNMPGRGYIMDAPEALARFRK